MLTLSQGIYAQPPLLDWVTVSTIGGGFQDKVEDVFVDPAGNTYVCGSFRGALTIGSDNLFGGSAGQAFVAKLDNAGTPIWAIQSNGDNQAFANSIIVDATGSVYVAGYHQHSNLSFAGLSLPSSSGEGFYVLKVSPNGNPAHLTGPTFASTGKSRANAIAEDGDFVYIVGSHKADLALPGGPTLPVTIGMSDVFLARVDSAFAGFTYAISHGGTQNDLSSAIAIDGNDLYLTGSYGNAPCTFFGGTNHVLPAYGHESIWLTNCVKNTGALDWATSAGSANGPSRGNDVMINGGQLYITGGCSDVCTFVETVSPTGPFVYDDTIFTNGGMDAFVARYVSNGALQIEWNEGGIGHDESYGITYDAGCSEVQICGSFEDSVNYGGTTPLIANGRDLFVSASDNSGNVGWVFKENGINDECAYAIHSNSTITSFGGEIWGDTYFATQPNTLVNHNDNNDYFVSSFQCGNPEPCGPTIDNCLQNDTVFADALCAYVLTDYTSSITVTDGCSTGTITVTQFPPALNILSAGVHTITLTAEDGTGSIDVCFFDVVVVADSQPILVECGDSFLGTTSGGTGDTYSSFSCSSISTPGQDAVYQVTVEEGNQFLQVKMDNAVDANDPYAYVYWLEANCPNGGTCVEIDSFEIATDQFSNNSQFLTFVAPGPGTYYLIVDSKTDSIESYDIEFYCTSSGIAFDVSNCDVLDTDLDGIVPFVNGSNADLTMQPCESVVICHDIYIANPDWEWLDSVQLQLGDCYENINVLTLTPDGTNNEFFAAPPGGDWTAAYNIGTNSITWNFAHGSGNAWGDGFTGGYVCQKYSFCFDADITSACATSEELNIGIAIGDDGGKGIGAPSAVFDIGNSNDFILQDDDPTFTYATNVLCNADPDISPDNIVTPGGQFTATAGISFVGGSPSASGQIDLTASTIGGPYTITYEVGLCPFTHDFIVDIFAQEDASFTYSAAAYCQADADPVGNPTGTGGGTFTGPIEIVFLNTLTGEIDLDASTVGGPYWVTYTTPGPNCINADSVQITINAEDDPAFTYTAIDYCAADPNELPSSITTGGGTFSEYTGDLTVNAGTGEVTISTSLLGNYYVVYTTAGICPNVDSVQFNVNVEDNPAFTYGAIAYCQAEANPVPSITGTGGGTFSGAVNFVSAATGEIDLQASTAGGPYTITYTTPGPTCPNSATFDVTINAEDDSTFSFASNIFCLADANPIPTISGTGGGIFSATAGMVLVSSATGEVDLGASTIGGPYTITYTTPGPDCPNSMDVIVNLYNEDDPTMTYAITTFCASDTDPIPTITTPGGTFTGAVTFIDNVTGEIDIDGSTPGAAIEIVYTSPGPECPNTDTAFITINALDAASFSYTDTAFCVTDLIAPATITGSTGGAFTTSDTSMIIDVVSGQIDLVASYAGGVYVVTYTTVGQCPDSSTANISIFDAPSADAGLDQLLFFRYETDLAATVPIGGNGLWTILGGTATIDDDTDAASKVNDLENGSTMLEWTVTSGPCPVAKDEMEIVVSELFIPEGLTPNNDNENDLFYVDGIELLENKVEIFNRWGQKVYEAENYANDWDGTDMTGNELSNDTYFYIITVTETTFKGFIVLKR